MATGGEETGETVETKREEDDLCKICCNDTKDLCFVGDYTGRFYPAHKSLLKNASGYFREYAAHHADGEGDNFGPIYVTDVEPIALVQCLDFIYTGYLDITTKNLQTLCDAALALKIDAIWDYCIAFAVSHVDFDSFFDLRLLAAKMLPPKLLDATEMFALCNFELLMGHEEFGLIDKALLLALLGNKKVKMIPEHKMYEAVLSWINFDPNKRKHNLPELLRLVNLDQIPVDYLKEVIYAEPLVMRDAECRNLLEEALWSHIHPTVAVEDCSSFLKHESIFIVDQNLQSVRSYNPWSGRWRDFAQYKGYGRKCTAVSIGKRIFVLGNNRCMFSLNTIANTWRELAKMATERGEPRATTIDGFIYASGGFVASTGKCMRTAERFDPERNVWQKIQSMKKPRARHCLAVTKGFVYAIGGTSNNNTAVKLVERIAPKQGVWMNVVPMKKPRSGAICVVKDESIYVLGGTFTPDVSIEVLNSFGSTWTNINLAIPKNFVAGCAIGDDIYILCRQSDVTDDDKFEIQELQLNGDEPVFTENVGKIVNFGAMVVCSC